MQCLKLVTFNLECFCKCYPKETQDFLIPVGRKTFSEGCYKTIRRLTFRKGNYLFLLLEINNNFLDISYILLKCETH